MAKTALITGGGGAIAVVGCRAHGEAEFGEVQKRVEKRRADNPDGGDEQIHQPDRNASDRKAPIRQIARDRARIRRADKLHELIEDEAEADRRKQRRDAGLAL